MAAVFPNINCYFCGGVAHNIPKCPAHESLCHNCEIIGHFSRVCRSKKKPEKTSWNFATMYALMLSDLNVMAAFSTSLSHAPLSEVITLTALVDLCSSESFTNQSVANVPQLAISPTTRNVSMTFTPLKPDLIGCCTTDITLNDRTYSNVKLGVLKDICSDITYAMTFKSVITYLVEPS